MFHFFKKHFQKKTPALPPFWVDYLALFDQHLNKRQSFREFRFVVFDTETTGLDLKKDRICQIGAVAVKGYSIHLKDFFDTLVYQESGGLGKVKEVHGLRDSVIQSGLEEEAAIVQFIQYLGNAIILAHHAAFDIGMINTALKRSFGPRFKLKNKYLDTAHMEKRLRPVSAYAVENPSDYSLDVLAGKYGIALHDRHTAIGDAFITAQIFLKIAARLEKRGVNSIGSLMAK
ncbi:MAG: 3'-5' exonuclease [Bacteroidota bacterium]